MEKQNSKLERLPELVRPSLRYKDSYIEAAKELESVGETRFFDLEGALENFDNLLRTIEEREKATNFKEGVVPQTELWLVEGEKLIGIVKIRHFLNKMLLKRGGHIGYIIRPSKRKRDYGTKILELALPAARGLGIDRTLLTCDDDNIGSAKIIEKNGGVLENKIVDEGKLKRRYWIEIK